MNRNSKVLSAILCLIFSLSSFAEDRAQNSMTSEGVVYSPIGKRDPFKELDMEESLRQVSAIRHEEKFSLEQLQLRAIIHGQGVPQAMFEDPEGRTFFIREGIPIGREKAVVSRILNREVILTEKSTNYLGKETLYERVVSLPSDNEAGVLEIDGNENKGQDAKEGKSAKQE